MNSRIKTLLKLVFGSLIPPRLRYALFTGAFSLMSTAERDFVRRNFQITSIEWSLRNLKSLGYKPRTIVDVGAYVGNWTRMAKTIFPDAEVLMVEAQVSKEPELKRVCSTYAGEVRYCMCLVGPEERQQVQFYELETGSSVMAERSSIPRREVRYPMRTLDSVIASMGFEHIDCLKLDVQGYELEVLKGGALALDAAQIVLMEVSLLPLNDGVALVHEVVAFMAIRGFRMYDICSLIRRPTDFALWQSDFLFVKENSPLLANLALD